jgi:Cu-Zn family superoxide dismutase
MKPTALISSTVGLFALLGFAWAPPVAAQAMAVTNRNVTVYAVDARGIGAKLGKIELKDVADGLRIKINLESLPPGPHGFHVHSAPDCSPAQVGGRLVPAGAAGPPYDPFHTGHHAGPRGNGYLGDLPILAVGKDGKAKYTMVAPRLKVDDVRNRALVITAGSDNFTDTPPMGGGGDAIACGSVL